MSSRSLDRWFATRLGAVLVVSAALGLSATIAAIDYGFDRVEQQFAQRQLDRVVPFLEQVQDSIEAQTVDYAQWDDTFEYLQDPAAHPDYIANNFTPDAAANLDIDWVVLQQVDAGVANAINLDGESPAPIAPETLTGLLREVTAASAGAARSSHLLWIGDALTLVGRAEVTDSLRLQPAHGWLYFGKRLDASRLDQFRRLTGVPFVLHSPGTAYSALPVASPDGGWIVMAPYARAPLVLGYRMPPFLKEQRRTTNGLLGGMTLLILLLAAASVAMMVRRKVVSRLQRFARLADDRVRLGAAAPRWPVEGEDEIDGLARSLNGMLDEVARHQGSLAFLAGHDPLTSLGNRRRLVDELTLRLHLMSEGHDVACTLVLLDVDEFKTINDGLGHAAGDAVLIEYAKRIAHLVRMEDVAVRLGGDEFAILLDAADAAHALQFCEKLGRELSIPLVIEARSVALTVSIGVAGIRPDYDPHDWLRAADLAMYEAKRNGKGRTVMFRDALRDDAARRVQQMQALRKAVEAGALEVWYQPVVDGRTGRVFGVEALVRWQHEGDYIPPSEFIPLAEESGLIVALGQFVLAAAGAMLARARVRHPGFTCSVNLSARQFVEGDLAEDLQACLRDNALPPDALGLEITENQVTGHETGIAAKMEELAALGFRFYLDDFGVGHSSLDRLRRLPIDTLKIDRSFVRPLDTGEDRVLRNIVNLAADLGMATIAEGVETEAERCGLIELGCYAMQGFLLGRPMNEGRLTTWLENRVVGT